MRKSLDFKAFLDTKKRTDFSILLLDTRGIFKRETGIEAVTTAKPPCSERNPPEDAPTEGQTGTALYVRPVAPWASGGLGTVLPQTSEV